MGKWRKFCLAMFILLLGIHVSTFITPPPIDLKLQKLHIIDWHAHVAGLGYGDSGAFINDDMRGNFRFKIYMNWLGTSEDELRTHGDAIVVQKLSEKVSDSKYVDQALVLALDGIIDRTTGELDRQHTQVYVPNEFVIREVAKYPNLLFGASINPYRIDSIARLRHAVQHGAVVIKWIPSIMHIDPSDKALIPFYKEMARLHIPLLTHTGMEKSFAHARNEFADPLKLVLPLQCGVTVIAAHIATTGQSEGQDNFERILPLFKQYPNLYADISSLTQINKLGFLERALKVPGLTDRMVYGTDWPLHYFPLVSPWYHIPYIGLEKAWQAARWQNPWDRDVALKMAYQVPRSVFLRDVRKISKGP